MVLVLLMLNTIGCGSQKVVSHDATLDSIAFWLNQADENLAVSPDFLQKRVDTMRAQLFYIDSVMPGLGSREDEVGLAYNVYASALKVFDDYLEAFDPFLLENQFLQKELAEVREGLKLKTGVEKEDLEARIPVLRQRANANYMATKSLIRAYLDVLRPFQRKRKIIDHLFLKLVEKNSDN